MNDDNKLKSTARLLLILGSSIGGGLFLILYLLASVASMGGSTDHVFMKAMMVHGASTFIAIMGWIPYALRYYRLAFGMAILPLLGLLALIVLLFAS